MNAENEKAQAELDWFFPDVDAGNVPLGANVLLQLRRTKKKSSGGIVLPEETKATEKWNNQVAKMIEVGPLAFKNRSTGERWPEGDWVQRGQFCRVPRWGGDRWEVNLPGEDEPAVFVIFKDHELITRVTGDPLQVKSFIL